MNRKIVVDCLIVMAFIFATSALRDFAPGGHWFAIGVGIALAFQAGRFRAQKEP